MRLLQLRRDARRLAGALALCTASGAGAADHAWFAVSEGRQQGSPKVEVDLNSLEAPLAWVEAVLRITHPARRPHASGFSYRSLLAVVRFDCIAARMQPVAVSYFHAPAAEGRPLGAETDLGIGVRPLAMAGGTARMLVKAACGLRSSAGEDAERCTAWSLPSPE